MTGGTTELKTAEVHMRRKSRDITQTCANMLKVAGYLTSRALAKGCLVEEISIFALLVSHKSPYCVPLKYHVHINKRPSIELGDEVDFTDGFCMMIAHLN